MEKETKKSFSDEAKKRARRIALRIVLTLLTAAYLCWIFSNSLQTAAQSGNFSEKVRVFVQSALDGLFGEGKISVTSHFIRKAAHFSEFALLGFLAYFTLYSYVSGGKRAALLCFFLAALFTLLCGATDESLQFLSAGRAPAVTDALIDFAGGTAGSACAALLFWGVRAACTRRGRKRRKNGA